MIYWVSYKVSSPGGAVKGSLGRFQSLCVFLSGMWGGMISDRLHWVRSILLRAQLDQWTVQDSILLGNHEASVPVEGTRNSGDKMKTAKNRIIFKCCCLLSSHHVPGGMAAPPGVEHAGNFIDVIYSLQP